MTKTYRVIEPCESPFTNSLEAKAGTRLGFERKGN